MRISKLLHVTSRTTCLHVSPSKQKNHDYEMCGNSTLFWPQVCGGNNRGASKAVNDLNFAKNTYLSMRSRCFFWCRCLTHIRKIPAKNKIIQLQLCKTKPITLICEKRSIKGSKCLKFISFYFLTLIWEFLYLICILP